MTTLEKKLIVAEKRGWRFHPSDDDCFGTAGPECWVHEDLPTRWTATEFENDYDTIESIRSAVLMQSEEFQNKFDALLWGQIHRRKIYFHQLIYENWLDNFMETVEKMK